MTRNIGEPCMCGDPACWVCGDGTPDDAPERDAATVPTRGDVMSLAVDYSCALGQEGGSFDEYMALARALDAIYAERDAAIARAESAERDWQDAEGRAAGAEAANADLRARVVALTAERGAGRALRTFVETVEDALNDPDVQDISPRRLRALGGDALTALDAYDTATAPATTAATAGEVQS